MRDRVMRALAFGWLVLVAPMALVAQAPAPPPPAFEVASVRLAAPGTQATQQLPDTRATLIRQSLQRVLLLAFRVKDYQLSAPGWLQDVQIDIQATLPEGATRQQVPEMLQQLLAQRFGLIVRRELRPLDVYELVVDPTGIKQMREVDILNELDREIPIDPSAPADALAGADRVQETLDGPVRTVVGEGLEMITVTTRSMYSLKRLADGSFLHTLSATRMTMAELATVLERVVGQPVFDRTNLGGLYAFTVVLPPNNVTREIILRRSALSPNLPPEFTVPAIDLASKALKDLGLRLEKRRAEIETIVVEKIERTPTDN
jgi:uncharacterized protein (TIGR03435 family)